MPIAQRGTAVTSGVHTATTLELAAPTGLAIGDLEIIAVCDDNASGNEISASGDGWATLPAAGPTGSGQHYSVVFWRVCPTVETVTITFENTAARFLGRSAFYWDGAGLTGWSKIDDDAAHTVGTADNLGAPTINVEAGQLFLLAATNDTTHSVSTPPADMTEVFNGEQDSAACALYFELSEATGSSPAKSVTWEGTDDASIIVGSFRAEVTPPSSGSAARDYYYRESAA